MKGSVKRYQAVRRYHEVALSYLRPAIQHLTMLASGGGRSSSTVLINQGGFTWHPWFGKHEGDPEKALVQLRDLAEKHQADIDVCNAWVERLGGEHYA
jgi:hypothetical protein